MLRVRQARVSLRSFDDDFLYLDFCDYLTPHRIGVLRIKKSFNLISRQIWRLDHAYDQRSEFRKHISKRPSEYLKKIYFDSILHSVVALQYLIEVVGADRVVIGTDYPMAMGDFEPVRKINALSRLSDEERGQILGSNAVRALNL